MKDAKINMRGGGGIDPLQYHLNLQMLITKIVADIRAQEEAEEMIKIIIITVREDPKVDQQKERSH